VGELRLEWEKGGGSLLRKKSGNLREDCGKNLSLNLGGGLALFKIFRKLGGGGGGGPQGESSSANIGGPIHKAAKTFASKRETSKFLGKKRKGMP